MTRLLSELDAFYLEHRRCGELKGAVAEIFVWLRCCCGAHLIRRIAPGEQERQDAQVPDQTGPHHAIHRAVPCAFLVSSRHTAG
jgi:hypothetical protein